MLSWSDFVTLLLAVFAAMYAGASVDLAKATLVAGSVGRALGAPAAPVIPIVTSVSPSPVGHQGSAQALEHALANALQALGLGDRISIVREGRTVGIDIDAELLFDEGNAALSPEAGRLLASLGKVLSDQHCEIHVEGHTDSTPISNARFASNWELSAARAAVVVRRLIAAGVPESRLSAIALASNRPLAANDTGKGRLKNRRVHLSLLSED